MPHFKLPYWISNNGDGSASVRPCATSAEADDRDEEQNNEGEGWAEPCSGVIDLKIENGKFYVYIFVDGARSWVEVTEPI